MKIVELTKKRVSLLIKRVNRCLCAAKRVHDSTDENTFFLFCEVVYDWCMYGCSDEDFVTMDFYRKNSREKKRWLTSAMNNRYLYKTVYDDFARKVFDHKEYFDKVFKHLMKHDILVLKEVSREDIISFLDRYGEVIVKPAGGACGIGIYKLDKNDGAAVDELFRRVEAGDDLIIEQLIVQHHEMARMNPYSVNTIRVITMVDKNGDVHIINTLAKFGGSNKCISNTLGGGCCCHIDEESGILDRPGKNIHGESVFRHPVTGVVIPGFRIPCWNGVIGYAEQLAKVVPSGRYIGWDIVILENGYDVIEGNIHPGQDYQGCDGIGRWIQIKALI